MTAMTATTSTTSTTFDDTEQRIRALLVKDFNLDPGALTRDARLDELGVDSIGMAELIFTAEDEFRLKLPDVAVQLSTFGEVVQFIDKAVEDQRAAEAPAPLTQAGPAAT